MEIPESDEDVPLLIARFRAVVRKEVSDVKAYVTMLKGMHEQLLAARIQEAR